MKWAVVVDSSSDMACLTEEIRGAVGNEISFDVVPLKIEVGENEFTDNEELDVDHMMMSLKEYNGKSGSASPSPQEYYDAFEKADNVIAITITNKLSGSFRSACAAKDMIGDDYPDKKIFVMDSRSTGPEMILLAHKAIEYIQAGMEYDELVEKMLEYQKKTRLIFVIESMDNLVKNGRVKRIEGGVAAILGIKVMGKASDEGELEIVTKSRGKTKVYDKLIDAMLNGGYNGGRIIINHCNNDAMAGYLKLKLIEKYPDSDVHIGKLRGLTSFYAENRGIIVGFEV